MNHNTKTALTIGAVGVGAALWVVAFRAASKQEEQPEIIPPALPEVRPAPVEEPGIVASAASDTADTTSAVLSWIADLFR